MQTQLLTSKDLKHSTKQFKLNDSIEIVIFHFLVALTQHFFQLWMDRISVHDTVEVFAAVTAIPNDVWNLRPQAIDVAPYQHFMPHQGRDIGKRIKGYRNMIGRPLDWWIDSKTNTTRRIWKVHSGKRTVIFYALEQRGQSKNRIRIPWFCKRISQKSVKITLLKINETFVNYQNIWTHHLKPVSTEPSTTTQDRNHGNGKCYSSQRSQQWIHPNAIKRKT